MAVLRVTNTNGQWTAYSSPTPMPSVNQFTQTWMQTYASSPNVDWLAWARAEDRDYSFVLVDPPGQFSFMAVCYRHKVMLVFWDRASIINGRPDEFMITYNNGVRETVGEKEAAQIILDFLEIPLDSRGEMR